MFSVNFLANQYVSDEDINAIGYNLSNTAYTSFTNDTLYGVNELNSITEHLMNKGVKRNYKNECAVTLNEGIIHIDSGLAFFDNGATITIDDDGIDLTLEGSSEQQYIYLFFDEVLNVAGARCVSTLPETNISYVILGIVSDGVLKQNRTFAFLNADVKGTNEALVITVEPTKCYVNGLINYEYATPINISKYRKIYFSAYREKSKALFGMVDVSNMIVEFRLSGNYKNGSFDANNFKPYQNISNATEDSWEQISDGILYIRSSNRFEAMTFEMYGGVED